MKILIVDIDSTIPNLVLMKIAAYYKSLGYTVGFNVIDPDMVYVSCIFPKNAIKAKSGTAFYKLFNPDCIIDIGGSGIDLKKELPPEIEYIKPDYSIYPYTTFSQGYTTRGCFRKCPFCFVPMKEGKIRINQHPSEFHDSKFDSCMIMDNNLFAAPQDWQESVFSWFSDNKIKMISPQGWDARLLTPDRAELLKSVQHVGQIHFAWDNIGDEEKVISAIELLKNTGFNLRSTISFYILVGFGVENGKPIEIPLNENDIYRCEKLKEMGVNAFVMPYHKNDMGINKLARWADWKQSFWAMPFKTFKELKI